MWDGASPEDCAAALRTVIFRSLAAADQASVRYMPRRTIALPLISSGSYGYPLTECIQAHLRTIKEYIITQSSITLTKVLIVTKSPSIVKTLQSQMKKTTITPSVPTLPDLNMTTVTVEAPLKSKTLTSEPTRYVAFTPTQLDTIISKLPDPDKHPMQFLRKLEQNRQIYGATWRDLYNMVTVKTPDTYLQVILKYLDASAVPDQDSYQSGLEFCSQMKTWAQECLTDQAGSIQDVQQEKDEPVDRYSTRLSQQFEDLGFTLHNKIQAHMLVKALVEGLQDELRDKVLATRPEILSAGFKDAVTIIKGFQKAQHKEKDKKKKKVMLMTTTSMDSDSDEEPVPAPIMVQQAPTGPPMPVNYYPQPPVPHASYPWQTPQQQGPFGFSDQRPRPTCWNCGRQGHVRRDCRFRPGQRPRDDYRPRQSGPRSDDYRGSQNRARSDDDRGFRNGPRPDDYRGSHDEPRYQDQRYQEPRPQDSGSPHKL
ncbi:uncharacterized protein [Engystomops pustulosus]|uniref:uncharacterized protein n=1 Tax=Engystomops pustulosus TaxID=76066 RepID=UPI003AFB0322